MDGQGIGDEYRIGGKVDELYLDGWTKKEGQGEKREGGMKKGSGEEKKEGYRSNYGLLSLLLCPDPGKNHCQEQGELRREPKPLLRLV